MGPNVGMVVFVRRLGLTRPCLFCPDTQLDRTQRFYFVGQSRFNVRFMLVLPKRFNASSDCFYHPTSTLYQSMTSCSPPISFSRVPYRVGDVKVDWRSRRQGRGRHCNPGGMHGCPVRMPRGRLIYSVLCGELNVMYSCFVLFALQLYTPGVY